MDSQETTKSGDEAKVVGNLSDVKGVTRFSATYSGQYLHVEANVQLSSGPSLLLQFLHEFVPLNGY
jgi:hypothetical protein